MSLVVYVFLQEREENIYVVQDIVCFRFLVIVEGSVSLG